MKTYRLISAYLLLAVLSLALGACSDNDEPELPDGDMFTNIVTLSATGSEGSTFTFKQLNDSPTITLTTSQTFKDANVKVGSRLVLQYVPESGKQYESGPVRVVAYASTLGPDIKTAASSSASNWSSDAVFLRASWRSGTWLNIEASVDCAHSPNMFELLLDPATENTAQPELHLVYKTDFKTEVFRTIYASYNIESLWTNLATRSVRVWFYGPMGEDSFVLTRENANLTPTE